MILLLAVSLSGCSQKELKTRFVIPECPSKQTLKEFARQAEVEILFDLQIVDDLRTKAVLGSFHPHDALGLMLEETNLAYYLEMETGAYAVAQKNFPSGRSTGRQ